MKEYIRNIGNKIFPHAYTNEYTGHKIAFYAFVPITLIQLWRSQHHLFAPDAGCQSIATVPLDTFTEMGAAATVSFASAAGLFQLMIAGLFLLSLIKYRSMIPLMYCLFVIEKFMSVTYFPLVKPVPTINQAPGMMIALPSLLLGCILLGLSLKSPTKKL